VHESDFKVEISFESLTMAERISKGRSVISLRGRRRACTMHDSPSS